MTLLLLSQKFSHMVDTRLLYRVLFSFISRVPVLWKSSSQNGVLSVGMLYTKSRSVTVPAGAPASFTTSTVPTWKA